MHKQDLLHNICTLLTIMIIFFISILDVKLADVIKLRLLFCKHGECEWSRIEKKNVLIVFSTLPDYNVFVLVIIF